MSSYLDHDDWVNVLENIAPYVSTFSERKQTIKTFLPDMLDTDYSGHEALLMFREAGIGINTKDFYDIRRNILDDPNLTSNLRKLGLDDYVTESLMRISSTEMQTKYQYVAAYAIENNETGEMRFGEFSILANDIGTKREILDEIQQAILAHYDVGSFETMTINLRRAYINVK